MKATLALEYIGEAQDAKLRLAARIIDEAIPGASQAVIGNAAPRRPWVAEIVGKDPVYKLKREFIPANCSRKHTNGAHSRGVELWFVLESGKLYEVKAPLSWRNSERYFCTVTSKGEIIRVTEKTVEEWLKNHSE